VSPSDILVPLGDTTTYRQGLAVTVKRLRSASRVLAVIEAIAEHQPIGVAALARHLDDDKSAVQRALMTLADDGWIRPAPGEPTRWELTPRIHVLAHLAQGHADLRQRARTALDALRERTGESIILAVPDAGRLVAIDVLESRQLIRTAPYVGMVIPAQASASGQAVLAHLDDDAQEAFLGEPLTPALRDALAVVRRRGWAINDGDIVEGATNVGAAILDDDGRPVAAIAVSAPSDRVPPSKQAKLGALVAETASGLSGRPARGRPLRVTG
jgi:IclR family acetate operon transcriptional repressor